MIYLFIPFIVSVAIFKALIPSDDFSRISVSSCSKVYWWGGGKITGAGEGSWDLT